MPADFSLHQHLSQAAWWRRLTGLSEVWAGADLSSRLLVLLRWMSACGQGLTLFLASELGVQIPWAACLTALGLTLFSNIGLSWWLRQIQGQNLGGGFYHVVLADVMTLTFLLSWTGGMGNPFALFYLVQLTLAGVALRASAVATLGLLTAASSALLFLGPVPLHMQDGSPVPPGLLAAGHYIAILLAGAFVLIMLTAIRKRSHRLQQERRKLQRELDSRERFLSVAALATGFAHELATPVGTIALAAEELQAEPDREIAATVAREAARCQQVLQRLRTLGQEAIGSAAEPRPVGQVLEKTLAEVPATQRQRIHTRLTNSNTAITVTCPGLEEALLVLLRNALLSSADDQPVNFFIHTEVSHIHFVVEDQGPGFPLAMLSRWGEPFQSHRPEGQGMGLGLFFVRRLAASMQGEARVENRNEGGARVTLTLPATTPTP